MARCLQEECANWDGDGCPCRVLDLEPVDVRIDPAERLLRDIFGNDHEEAPDA